MRYLGRAAVPLPGAFGGFSKVYFVQPETYELYGRVQVPPLHTNDCKRSLCPGMKHRNSGCVSHSMVVVLHPLRPSPHMVILCCCTVALPDACTQLALNTFIAGAQGATGRPSVSVVLQVQCWALQHPRCSQSTSVCPSSLEWRPVTTMAWLSCSPMPHLTR